MTETSVDPPPRLGEIDLHHSSWEWPRFGIRTLLLVVLLAATPLAWMAWRAIHVRRQEAVLEQVSPFGGQAGWMSGNVVQLTFRGDQFRDEAITHLRKLPDLERLVLIDTSVTLAGLQRLGNMPLKELKVLRAPHLKMDAEQSIAWPSTLRSLWLEETGVDDLVVEQISILPNLRSLSLIGSPITNAGLVPLAKLSRLEEIYMQRTKVTPEGVDQLQRDLPKCTIGY